MTRREEHLKQLLDLFDLDDGLLDLTPCNRSSLNASTRGCGVLPVSVPPGMRVF